ncbi:MAG: hypothetical protein ABSE75_08405 [Acidimicrobiales bacterium]|jgi:hypothetical protein
MDSTFATQYDDVSSTKTVRAEAHLIAADSVSPAETAPSNFLLALIPAQFKELFAESSQPTLVTIPLNEVPDGWSLIEALLTQDPTSPTNASSAVAPSVLHHDDDASGISPQIPVQSSVTNDISFINFLAASSCLVTGEL